MRKVICMTLFSLLGIGCQQQQQSPMDASGIHIESPASDVPAFERIYTAKIDERCSIKIVLKYYWRDYEVYKTGELDQPDGKWILFDPDAIAEKILDRTLVPLVQAKVNAIMAMDKAWRDSKPAEFIDKQGVHWQRKP